MGVRSTPATSGTKPYAQQRREDRYAVLQAALGAGVRVIYQRKRVTTATSSKSEARCLDPVKWIATCDESGTICLTCAG